jgi:hypothetical protein
MRARLWDLRALTEKAMLTEKIRIIRAWMQVLAVFLFRGEIVIISCNGCVL